MEREQQVATYPIRLAYLGVGGWGANPLRASAETELIEIAGVCDINPNTARAAAEKYGCKVWDNYEQILADDSLDGVIFTLPPDENLAYVKRAAAIGRHCYVAKPIAAAVADGLAMKRLCAEAGVALMVGHNDRRRGEVRMAQRLVADGRIGQPVLFEGNFSHMGGWSIKPEMWRSQRDRCPTVPLMMLGIHAIDSMISIMGPARAVRAFHKHAAMPVDNEDLAVTIFEMEKEALAYVGDSYVSPYSLWYRISGTKGIVEVAMGSLRLLDAEAKPTEIEFAKTDPDLELMEEFARAVVEGARPETDAEESLKSLACVEASLISAREARSVEIAELLG
jgi:predicted dehydrogenase